MTQYVSAINQGAFRLGSRAWETNGYGHWECIYEREEHEVVWLVNRADEMKNFANSESGGQL